MGAAYIECSAKESRGVHEVFEMAINTAIKTEEDSYEAKPDLRGVKVKKAKKRKCNFL
jgi:Ras homolog gene family, member A